MSKERDLYGLLLLIAIAAWGCGGASTTTSNATKAEAEAEPNATAILAKMTDKIKSAPAVSFTSAENADRPKRGGGVEKLKLTRSVTFKSPDRMYFKATGDRDLEAFYDGKDMTMMSHKEKVWGKLLAAPTLTETLEKIKVHYGMPLPVADLLGLDPTGQLRNAANTAAVEKTESLGGVDCNVLSFKNADVDWQVWIPVTGDPLPKKFHATYKTPKGPLESIFEFSDWNLAAQVTDATFTAKVPEEYEGIPVIKRASAVLAKLEAEDKNAAANENTAAPAPADAKKK